MMFLHIHFKYVSNTQGTLMHKLNGNGILSFKLKDTPFDIDIWHLFFWQELKIIIIGYKNPIYNNHKNCKVLENKFSKNYARPMEINLTRHMQDLHRENGKFLLKDIKEYA